MESVFFEYFLYIGLWVYTFKSAFKGATSEIISLIFFSLAFSSAVVLYRSNNIESLIISISIFSIIYIFGLHIASSHKKSSVFQFIFGLFVGAFKFLTYLTCLTTICMLINATPDSFLQNQIVQIILPYSISLKDAILKYNNSIGAFKI